MKKLLIAGGIASALVMTGCASTHNNEAVQADPHHNVDGYQKHHKGAKPPKHDGMFQAFKCENNAVVHVHFLPKQDKALVNVTAPTWKLDHAHIDMTAATAASGQRFVNETNPAAKYEWHSKGDMGVLSVTNANDQTASLNCEATDERPPMPPQGKPPVEPAAN